MTLGPDARQYLRDALTALDVDMSEASHVAGVNHAYIQQYISRGKPKWLPENIRQALVDRYGIDGEKLKPPPVISKARVKSSGASAHLNDQPKINVPDHGKVIDDSGEVEFLEAWRRIHPDLRGLAMTIIRNMAATKIPKVG